MLTGWNQIGDKWYYMYSSGAMAFNTWIGSYYVNGSGVWTKTRRSYPAARGLKALCDGIGIGCYYVHANSKASNPSHQWNEVRVNGQWYITDLQLGISTLEMIGLPFLMSESTYSSMFGMAWNHTGLPNCPKDYK